MAYDDPVHIREDYEPDTLVNVLNSAPGPDMSWCDGCKTRGLELTLFENEKYYCVACADRVAGMLRVRPMSELRGRRG